MFETVHFVGECICCGIDMANPSFGHILIVRRQSYIPSYFSVYESQLSSNNEYSEYENHQTSYSELGSGARFHWLRSETLTSQNQLHSAGYLTIPLKKMTEDSEESGTLTTRLLSSGIAKRFSCNVSKMAYRLRNRTICDGYYGCPDEKLCTEKGNGKLNFIRPSYFSEKKFNGWLKGKYIGNKKK